jgi:hypothetical protein
MGSLASDYVSGATQSFKMICVGLLDTAYTEVRGAHIVKSDCEENAISEILKNMINANPTALQMHITANVEQRLLPEDLYQALPSVKRAPRIDIIIGGFEWEPKGKRVAYYMEAKNLYSQDFKKTNNTTITSSTAYAKRYISTGIDHILSGYYPEDALLLGYVLVGTVAKAVEKVNEQLEQDGRDSEYINLGAVSVFPHLIFGESVHPNAKSVEHCYLQF